MMKLEPRPDMPPALTAALNALIEAYLSGTLKGVAVAAYSSAVQPDSDEVALRPLTVMWAANGMVRAFTRDEMGLLLDEAKLDEIMARKRRQAMAEQAARHAEEDARAKNTILGADGAPLTH